MTLKRREKVLMITAGIAVVGVLLYSFGLGDFVDQVSSQTDQLAAAEKQYVESIETLQKAAAIQKRYGELESLAPSTAGGKRPDLVFTEEVVALSRGMNARPDPAEYEAIEGIEDYEFLTVRLRTEGNLQSIVTLLKAFESRGLLFREVDLATSRDSDVIRSAVTLARIAAVPEDVIKSRAKEKKALKSRKTQGYE